MTADALPKPYGRADADQIYNLLFCDHPELFHSGRIAGDSPLGIVLSEASDIAAVRKIAEDGMQESRVRALAFHWLRRYEQPVPTKVLLGVIVEVPQDGGLDTLAAYPDGRVRYINQTGKMSIFEEAPPDIVAAAKTLLEKSQPVVNAIGPWDKPRLPPPILGRVRLSFLVSDGLYFGEGEFDVFAKDAMAGPIIKAATDLLVLVVNTTAPVH